MYNINAAVSEVLLKNKIKTRPNADPGVWLMFLLPFSLIICTIKHPREITELYRLCSTLSVGLISTSAIFVMQCVRKKPLTIVRLLHLIPAATTATIFRYWLHRGLVFSLSCGMISSFLYWQLLLVTFRMLPFSFTLGEVSVVVQGSILFLFATIINVFDFLIDKTAMNVLNISTIIIQVGLCAIGLICLLTYNFKGLQKTIPFYTVACLVIAWLIGILLHILIKQNPFLWIVYFLIDDITRIKMFIYYIACTVAAVVAVNRQIKGAAKATPAIRKVFHIFAVAVFLPGLLYNCTFIYLASGVVLGIFATLEMLRILNIPPLGSCLQNGYILYRDDKDTGPVALTPMYLLAGCAMPIWIHPSPCDLLDSAGYNLLPVVSGILSIGIGDTFASVIGSAYGKHFWPGTKKTFEGTIGCILSQVLVVWTLITLGLINTNEYEGIKAIVAIVIGSLVEAKTTQIDNIVLPLILFILLC